MTGEAGNEEGVLPVACNLPGPEGAERRQEVAEALSGGVLRVDELEDGYAFGFPGDAEWAERLVSFISFERVCCPFFAFELAFEPGGGPIVLRVRGPEGAKQFVEAELTALRVR